MSEPPSGQLSAQREEQVRRRLADGHYSSADALDRLAERLTEVLRPDR